MFEFPPTVWAHQHWTLGKVLCILVFGLVVPILAERFSSPRAHVIILWFLFVGYLWYLNSSYWFQSGKTFAPYRYMLALPLLASTIAGFAMFRIYRLPDGTRALGNAAVLLSICVVIFIILVLPDTGNGPRTPWRRSGCKNNLKQIGLALFNYHDTWQKFPPPRLGPAEVSWRVALLPFIEQPNVSRQYDWTQRWDSAANVRFQYTRIEQYACPARPTSLTSDGRFLTSYVASTLAGAVFDTSIGFSESEVRDGISNSLFVAEACGTTIVWTSPVDMAAPANGISINQPGVADGLSGSILSSWHPGGAQALLGDGSVQFLSTETDRRILRALITKDGREPPE